MIQGLYQLYYCQQIVYRDVKPANMLLFEKENKIKLCDFGSVETEDTDIKIKGTPRYLSPELFKCYISG